MMCWDLGTTLKKITKGKWGEKGEKGGWEGHVIVP